MPESLIDRSRASLEGVPEGPWEALTTPGDRTTAPAWILDAGPDEVTGPNTDQVGRTLTFAAEARTLVPALLTALEQAETKRAEAERDRDHARDDADHRFALSDHKAAKFYRAWRQAEQRAERLDHYITANLPAAVD